MATIHQTASDLDGLIQRLKTNESRLAEKLAMIRKHLDAAQTTRALLRQGDPSESEQGTTIPAKDLQGKTQLEALEYIARMNHNRLRISAAKTLLSKAGLLRGNKKNYYNILFTVITRSNRYKRVSPGEYELLPEGEKQRVMGINKGYSAA